MSRACAACEGRVRKGTGKLAIVTTRDGAAVAGIVCARCAARGVLIVSAAPATVAPACDVCGRGSAKTCSGCVDRLAENVKELSAANVVLKKTRSVPS